MGKHYKADNSGGYGNPPVKDQFKKRGPPGPGRPKGSVSMIGALGKVFGGKLDYTENGKPVTSAATIALAKRALALGLTGPNSANARALDLATKHGPQDTLVDLTLHNLASLSCEELEQFEILISKALGVPYEPETRKSDPFDYLNGPERQE